MATIISLLTQLPHIPYDPHCCGVDRIDYLRLGLEYCLGERRTLAPPEMIIALMVRIGELEGERDSFRKSCDERDKLIAELLAA